ncbi:MAG TPA: recombinase family protein [Roseiarcus sp.]|nr:recombinase family protein [Roseiarcus sp.]
MPRVLGAALPVGLVAHDRKASRRSGDRASPDAPCLSLARIVHGLGLEAQQTAVRAFIASRGADAKLVASFVEVESGKRSDNRPELTRAMEHARLTGSTLLIAKLDRRIRNI